MVIAHWADSNHTKGLEIGELSVFGRRLSINRSSFFACPQGSSALDVMYDVRRVILRGDRSGGVVGVVPCSVGEVAPVCEGPRRALQRTSRRAESAAARSSSGPNFAESCDGFSGQLVVR
jgi:hypothetical protein